MTLAQPAFRNLHVTPLLAGLLLLIASIVVTLGVFSANLADLDGIIIGIGAVPGALAVLIVAEGEKDLAGGRMWAGLAAVAAGLAVAGWSAYLAWEYAENFPGHELRYFAVEFLPFAATGTLLILSGLAWARLLNGRGVLVAGAMTGASLAAASVVAALAFATADVNEGEEVKTFLAALIVPLSFSFVVIASALRHGNSLRRLPYLPLAGFVLIISIAITSAVWSAATAEHRIFTGDFIGTPPSPPDVMVTERLYAFARLAMFPFVLGIFVLLSGPYRRGVGAIATIGLLLAIGFAGWSAAGPSRVPVPNFSAWNGTPPISSTFWIFAGVLITPFAIFMLAMSRVQRAPSSDPGP